MRSSLLFLFCFGLFVSFFMACQPKEAPNPIPDYGTAALFDQTLKPFYHGVASGDPLTDKVVIWTRVTPDNAGEVEVSWTIDKDANMKSPTKSGVATTNADRDYTIKIDVSDLEAGTTYFYQFEYKGKKSPVGRTKTATEEGDVKFAVVSCSNYEAGYFNAFGRIAERDDLDAVIHLGDYIYEYGVGVYGDTTLGRLNLPPHEIVKVEDYRTRYAVYRLDKDFQKAHQNHPFIAIWDDHEITNNAYIDGAQNHQADKEGDYMTRREIARKVYFEWLPIRESEGQEIYRTIRFGKNADLILLDERLAGRTVQADSLTQPDYASEDRHMLGKKQLDWFYQQLTESKATWKVIGNQVIFSDLDFGPQMPWGSRNLDAWDGYPAEKGKVIDFIQENSLENMVFITGDTHCSWAFEVPESIEAYKENPENTVAVEFGTTSVSSSNYDERVSMDTVRNVEQYYMDANLNPHLKYANLADHGYLLLTLGDEEAKAEWLYVDTVKEPSKNERTGKTFIVKKGTHQLVAQ